VLSINPFWYNRERDLAGQIVKIQNEKLAELCASRPDRFAAFASLTLQAPDLAVQELETAVKKQGLKGAAIGDVVNGVEFSDPKFHPVWAKAEELGVPLFIHPQGIAELSKRFAGNGWLVNTIGNPLGTTLALSHLIFEGTFDRFAGLKVIAAHGGGFLPSYADRSDHACLVGPKGCNPNVQLKKMPTEYPSRSISIRWSSHPRRSAIWRFRLAPARSCWAATTPIPGSLIRWTTFSTLHRSATTKKPTSSAGRRKGSSIWKRTPSGQVR